MGSPHLGRARIVGGAQLPELCPRKGRIDQTRPSPPAWPPDQTWHPRPITPDEATDLADLVAVNAREDWQGLRDRAVLLLLMARDCALPRHCR
jgi:hypothetical protein